MADNIVKYTPNLFGMPSQFTNKVDHREKGINSYLGKKYIDNMITQAPICTIIPGEPRYMPGNSSKKKEAFTQAYFSENMGFSQLNSLIKGKGNDDFKLYDFKNNYTEYMKYVNILCRAGAVLLNLDDAFTIGGKTYSFQRFDWKNYRLTSDQTKTVASRGITALKNLVSKNKDAKKLTSKNFLYETADLAADDNSDWMTNYKYVQFYVDASSDSSESATNDTTDSMFKSMLDTNSTQFRELGFLLNAGVSELTGSDGTQDFVNGSISAFQSGVSAILGNAGGLGSTVARILNLGAEGLKGNNIVLPSIYNSSSFSRSYSITVDLKTPYGTPLGYYFNIFVPLMHLMALALPRQETANTYGSPFLVKAYIPGTFSCNLGLVTSIDVNRVGDSYSLAGLPSEVKVTLSIADLYADLTMSPSSSPGLFMHNTSLIEWLATNCGVDLTRANPGKKWDLFVNTYKTALTDIPGNIKSKVDEYTQTVINDYFKLA